MIYLICYLLLSAIVFISTLYFHYEINEGFHSYGNNARVNGLLKNCVIGRFIIPKNSKYYVNKDGEYVSETIILKNM